MHSIFAKIKREGRKDSEAISSTHPMPSLSDEAYGKHLWKLTRTPKTDDKCNLATDKKWPDGW
jgi:hypothetical protein